MTAPNLPALSSLDDFLKHQYDFIIIGGGTAGLVMAARLTEIPNIFVGVLEAGAANIGDPMIMMPAMYVKTIGDPKYDWNHKSVHQKGVTRAHVKDMPRGKGLGGSSSIHYQMYVRGDKVDYDDWEKLGNKGWGFKDLFPYFKKHENFQDPKDYKGKPNIPLETTFDLQHHGHDGPIQTSFSTWRLPLEKEWIEASTKLGAKMCSPEDAWSGDHMGIYHSLSSIDRASGTRSYSVTGYLLPNAGRPNLHILTEALVSKLVIDLEGTVTGVEFLHGDSTHTVLAKKEVILSAGAVKTPQILELSGIGNPEILSKAGVKTIINNPRIGENFQDHPATGTSWELAPGETSTDILQDPAILEQAIVEYTTHQSGPLSSGGAAMGFVSYASLSTPEEIASLQHTILTHQLPGGYNEATLRLLAESIADPNYASIQLILLPAALNLEDGASQTAFLSPPPEMVGKQGVVLAVAVARPISTGSCHITNTDPRADPAIDPAYITHPADIEILQKGLELAEQMLATSPLKEKLSRRYFPRDDVVLSTKEGRVESVKANTATEYHLVGGASMGVEGVGVVDERLRVRGAGGLRVVDASIMPVHVSGNTQATVYAIAEKGADLVREDWGLL